MSHRPGSRRLSAASGLVIVALALAACGGGAASVAPSDTPAVTPKPAPTPSPSPADVAAPFLKAITSPTFSAAVTLTGTVKVGANSGTITGTGKLSGADSDQVQTIKSASTSTIQSSISLGSKNWSKQDPGPWLEDPVTATPRKGLDDFLRGLTAVKDFGIETRDGKKLHHLQPAAGNAIPAEFVGFANTANAKDGAFTIDFYATDDGTPAILVLAGTWTVVNGDAEAPAEVTYSVALSGVGTPQTITAPDDVWVRYHSKTLGYTMAHPADWTVTSAKDKDTYLLNGQGYVYVAISPGYKGATAKFAADLKVSYKKPFGGDPSSETPRTLGGQPAVRLVYQYTNASAQDVTIADDVTVRGGTGWEAFLVTAGGTDDITVFDQFVSTFVFDK